MHTNFRLCGSRETAICEDIVKQFPGLPDTSTGSRRWRLSKLAAVCGFAAVAACVLLPAQGRAQDLTGNRGLILPVSSVRLTPLPDAAMAVVTGMGLKTARPANGNSGSSPSIVLWDELRPTVHEPALLNGLATVTVNGVMQ
jgi:hypothetical protein